MNIGENIKKIRIWKGIPQKEISSQTKIPQGTLSKIEGGNDFLWSKLVKIAHALQCEVQDIVCFDSSKVTFNFIGDKSKGMVINTQFNENEHEVIRLLKEENAYLRKMLEKSIGKSTVKKSKYGK